ncbi:MAG: hypothetical protein QM740_20285 [Acidovorax sp.]
MYKRPILFDDLGVAVPITLPMIRFGNQIRLTRPEAETFAEITNFDPEGIRTEADLLTYADECKRYYSGSSYEARFLCWLIDQHLGRCVRGHPVG